MSQSLKQIKNRIRSIESTKKVTAAMQMVSSVKLNRIENQLFALRPYALKLESFMHNLAASGPAQDLEFFSKKETESPMVVCLITSDGGLCGLYNQNVIKSLNNFLEKNNSQEIRLVLIGQKGLNFFKNRGLEILNSFTGLNGKFNPELSREISDYLVGLYLGAKASSVWLVYTYFENSLFQRVNIDQFLNIPIRIKLPVDYICEPDLRTVLAETVRSYLQTKISLVLLESLTSEHASRTVSMKTATDNARELLKDLVLLRNKVRQQAITQDMLEIISSVEALKG